jgi:hypothetical protein
MSIKNSTLVKAAMLLAAISGSATGVRASEAGPSWPNQCYNSDGSLSCPICGSTCLGGNYLCCNNGAGVQEEVAAN